MSDMRPEEDARISFAPRSSRPVLIPPAGRNWRRLAPVLAAVAILVFGIGIWATYTGDSEQAAEVSELPPLGETPEGPAKVEPEDPGGMVIPNQDKQVFEDDESLAVEGSGSEQLLPPPEMPLPGPAPLESSFPQMPTVPAAPGSAAPAATAPAAPAAAPPAAAPAQQAALPTPAPTTAAVAQGIRIQIASFRDRAAALKAWPAFSQQHGEVLAGLTPYIESAEVADKGTYHRLQAGPFADLGAAKSACQKLKAVGQGCLVVGN